MDQVHITVKVRKFFVNYTKDPARFSGQGRLGDLGLFLLENRKVRELDNSAQVFWKVV